MDKLSRYFRMQLALFNNFLYVGELSSGKTAFNGSYGKMCFHPDNLQSADSDSGYTSRFFSQWVLWDGIFTPFSRMTALQTVSSSATEIKLCQFERDPR